MNSEKQQIKKVIAASHASQMQASKLLKLMDLNSFLVKIFLNVWSNLMSKHPSDEKISDQPIEHVDTLTYMD